MCVRVCVRACVRACVHASLLLLTVDICLAGAPWRLVRRDESGITSANCVLMQKNPR